jgi:hypothetical protein
MRPHWRSARVAASRPDEGDARVSAGLESEHTAADVIGESRWPMAGAVLAVMIFTILLPGSVQPGPPWLLPSVEGLLLVVLVVADPGKIDRRSRELRAISILLVTVIVVGTLWSTTLLIHDLIRGGPETNSATDLLEAGAVVWVSNNIAFALLYWELDGCGAATRAHHLARYVDIAFPQQLNPGLAPAGWRPRFIDYLYLGFTNATAFSPTDAMPLVPWAKIAMSLQAVISLAILGLVVARAVNVFN